MQINNTSIGTIHAAVFRQGNGPLRRAPATKRPDGAVRYRCPVAGSFVLVTEAAALQQLAEPRARIRCVACGEVHLLAHECVAESPSPPERYPAIVAGQEPA
jgi:hypothetical protein